MLRRLKQALVESFVGAIALGWLLAQAITHCAYAIVAPLGSWLLRDEYRAMTGHSVRPAALLLRDSVPELLRAFALLVIGYFLLRWLFFAPMEKATGSAVTDPK
jgi:hypothetical protein